MTGRFCWKHSFGELMLLGSRSSHWRFFLFGCFSYLSAVRSPLKIPEVLVPPGKYQLWGLFRPDRSLFGAIVVLHGMIVVVFARRPVV